MIDQNRSTAYLILLVRISEKIYLPILHSILLVTSLEIMITPPIGKTPIIATEINEKENAPRYIPP